MLITSRGPIMNCWMTRKICNNPWWTMYPVGSVAYRRQLVMKMIARQNRHTIPGYNTLRFMLPSTKKLKWLSGMNFIQMSEGWLTRENKARGFSSRLKNSPPYSNQGLFCAFQQSASRRSTLRVGTPGAPKPFQESMNHIQYETGSRRYIRMC